MDMKVTLQIDGKKRTFFNVENISIEEDNVKSSIEDKNFEVAQTPIEGKWFEVKPLTIDQTLFKEKREDEKQEKTRKLILEAFEELKNNPEKYGRDFKVMVPEKTWMQKSVTELKKIACNLGDHMANYVEQAFEWAQRIANGESWEDLCNKPDTANWYRVVIWKKDHIMLIGGSIRNYDSSSATDVSNYSNRYNVYNVPLVVDYEE